MKNISKIIILIIISITFITCDSNNDEIENNTKTKFTPKQFEFIGLEHNELLTQTYEFLNKNKKEMRNKTGKQNKIVLENFLINKIASNKKYSNESNEIGIKKIKEQFRTSNSFPKMNFSKNKSTLNLSEKEIYYLDLLKTILVNIDPLQLTIENEISSLEKTIQEDTLLNNKQLYILYSATQTAKFSYSYWSENKDLWITLSSDLNKDSCPDCWTNAGIVATADVAGAVGGAVTAAIVNVMPGPGQVAYAGAIVGAGVGASVSAGVVLFINWLWS